jgi:hypothetical protein
VFFNFIITFISRKKHAIKGWQIAYSLLTLSTVYTKITRNIHCKKGQRFSRPQPESLVSDIPAGDGKTANLFLQSMLNILFPATNLHEILYAGILKTPSPPLPRCPIYVVGTIIQVIVE